MDTDYILQCQLLVWYSLPFPVPDLDRIREFTTGSIFHVTFHRREFGRWTARWGFVDCGSGRRDVRLSGWFVGWTCRVGLWADHLPLLLFAEGHDLINECSVALWEGSGMVPEWFWRKEKAEGADGVHFREAGVSEEWKDGIINVLGWIMGLCTKMCVLLGVFGRLRSGVVGPSGWVGGVVHKRIIRRGLNGFSGRVRNGVAKWNADVRADATWNNIHKRGFEKWTECCRRVRDGMAHLERVVSWQAVEEKRNVKDGRWIHGIHGRPWCI